MEDQLIIFDGSRKMHVDLPLNAIYDVVSLRGEPKISSFSSRVLLNNFAQRHLNRERGQVNSRDLILDLNETDVMQHYTNAGKIIFLDDDLYCEGLNWSFGNMTPTSKGLGYVVLSTNRMQDDIHATDIIRHELGHMFNAPSEGRRNTVENLGLHCTMPECVMQQKTSVSQAVAYAHQRAQDNSPIFCVDCETDIKAYRAPR